MVRILTPQLNELLSLPAGQVETWLASNGCVARNFRSKTIIAIPAPLEEELRRAETGEVPLLTTFRGDLILQLGRLLHEHGRAVYMPVQRPREHYLTPPYFFRHMEQVLAELPEARIYLPAGLYGEPVTPHPRRSWLAPYACGFEMALPANPDPATWPATQKILRRRAQLAAQRRKIRRRLQATEARLGGSVPQRRDARFTDENDHNPWVLEDCPTCEGHNRDCESCGGLGTSGEAVRYFQNDTPAQPAILREDGWLRCPGCARRFATYDRRRWTGLRHTTCGQKILCICIS